VAASIRVLRFDAERQNAERQNVKRQNAERQNVKRLNVERQNVKLISTLLTTPASLIAKLSTARFG
jgi:hypothetical protein